MFVSLLSILLIHPRFHVFSPVVTFQVGHPMRNNTKGLMLRDDVTIMARFIEMDSHLFLTLETLSAASCLASFSLSSLSFLVQARIALIKPGHKSETEKFPPVPHTVNLLFEIILFYPILLPSAFALDNVSETNQSS